MRILLVEDDQSVLEALQAILIKQDYLVDVATDGEMGWELAQAISYDLILLDVMLPKLDGISFCRRLREQKNPVPILLLTARDTTNDKSLGLDNGADDYVVKPFDHQELSARIRALLRRGNTPTLSILECGLLQLDSHSRQVMYGNQVLQFSRKEYLLLELFLRNQQRVFSRSAIVDQLWTCGEDPPSEDTVKSHIKSIRRKLQAVAAEDFIETVYGQGYRINPMYLSSESDKLVPPQAQSLMPTGVLDLDYHLEQQLDKQQIVDLAVAEIWQRTRGTSLDRITLLSQFVQMLKVNSFDEVSRQEAIQSAHKLAGSLGTFGFEEGSRLARQIELLLQSEGNPKAIAHQAEPLISELHIQLDSPINDKAQVPRSEKPQSALIQDDQPLLLIVDIDLELAESIAAEAVAWKIRAAIATDLQAAQLQLDREAPQVVLLDTALTAAEETGQILLNELSQRTPPIPVVVFSAQDKSADRLTALKLGGQLFLQKPTTPFQVLRAVVGLLQPPNCLDAKILAVDDDPQVLLLLKEILEPEGISLTGLQDPSEFWETLKSIQPDLLILDINLATLSGLDLCQSVRNDFQWSWLPILFLTINADRETIQQVFAVGADDYVTKPILAKELSIQVLNRLKRSRLLRSQAETDVLTGVSNRQQSTQALNQLLQLAHLSQQPLCLAVLDLDYFKRVNDRYGHIQGDRVLRQFGQFLKQKFRSGDVVARWGGEEFVIGMYGISRLDGMERLAESLEEWRSLGMVTSTGEPLYVSFSAGIAQYPIDGNSLQILYRTADAALYRAKQAGRDCVLSTAWQPLSQQTEIDVLLAYPNTPFAYSLLKALKTRGYHSRWVQSAQAMLTLLERNHTGFEAKILLLSDELSDMDSIALIRNLDDRVRQQTHIILLLNQPDKIEAAQALGIPDYFLTPCSAAVIMQRLRQLLIC
jgi:diguanylate cyclase (GGDEF)-like protein